MRIVIDMQGAQTDSRYRGIGRYTISLIQSLIKNKGDNEIILALNGLLSDSIETIRSAFDELLPQENIKVWYSLGPVYELDSNNGWRREIAELVREEFLNNLRPDVVLLTSLFEGFGDDAVTSINLLSNSYQTAVILYDLIPLKNPDFYFQNKDYKNYYTRKIEFLKKSQIYLAISDYTLTEATETLNLDRDKVFNISSACDDFFSPISIDDDLKNKFKKEFNISKEFILYSGGADSRKNLHRLILAFASQPEPLRQQYQLVFVGKIPLQIENELKDYAIKHGLTSDQFRMIGYVSDDNLVKFLNLATLFVFPSLYEGFGLPVLEAMSCGTAVISADGTSLPEVIGNPQALFNPYDENDIAKKINEILIDNELRSELITKGLAYSKNFSWESTAQKILSAFDKLVVSNSKGINGDSLINKISNILASYKISDLEVIKIAQMISLNQSEYLDKNQLLIDISELNTRDSRTGIQRVTRSILKILLEKSLAGYIVKPIYATMDSEGYKYAYQFLKKNFDNVDEKRDCIIEYRSGDIFLGLDLQSHIVVKQKDYLLKLREKGCRVLFVVYDLLPVLLPHVFSEKVDFYHKIWLDTLEEFDGVICISNAVAEEYKQWQLINGKKHSRPFLINWFHLGADIDSSLPSMGIPNNANMVFGCLKEKTTFLIVGTIEPRKGHEQVLNSFDILWEKNKDINLVLVGKQGWNVDKLLERIANHPYLDKKLFWLNGISDEYLEKIYDASTCLIAASYGEGFGLPLIEAAQYKLPIIARDIPVFKEVAGDHAFYFDAKDPDELASAIQDWLVLYEKNEYPTSVNMPWLTWEQSANQLLKIILDQP